MGNGVRTLQLVQSSHRLLAFPEWLSPRYLNILVTTMFVFSLLDRSQCRDFVHALKIHTAGILDEYLMRRPCAKLRQSQQPPYLVLNTKHQY